MIKLINKYLKKLKEADYSIDRALSLGYLVCLIIRRIIMAAKGTLLFCHKSGIVFIASNTKIRCKRKLTLGRGVTIELLYRRFITRGYYWGNVSLHPENHNFTDRQTPIRHQGVSHKGIIIGNGCIIAASSVVSAGEYADYGIYSGESAKLIKNREEQEYAQRRYGIKRIYRKVLFWIASSTQFLETKFRTGIHKLVEVNIINPRRIFMGREVVMGMNVGIVKSVNIEKGVVFDNNSLIANNLLPMTTCAGDSAKVVKEQNIGNMTSGKHKITFIHFFNNFSGSPNVLSIIATEFVARGYHVEIMTNHSYGFLSDIKGVSYRFVHYRLCRNKIITFIYFLLCQIQLFYKILFSSNHNTIYYINTIAPVGAVLACWLSRKKRIYHSHENMRAHKALYYLYKFVYGICNTKTIFVSKYVMSTAVRCRNAQVIYNALNKDFTVIANQYIEQYKQTFGQTILMVASLRSFKGVYEFVELAKRYKQYTFELVLNATEKEIVLFTAETQSPGNLIVYSVQKNLHPFYQRAKVLLQLSNPNLCVETFGLTILEAMVYGIPSIVPNVGGPLELIEDGVNGFTLSPLNLNQVGEKLELLMNDDKLYKHFSESALAKSKEYDVCKMIDKIEKYIWE